MMKYNVRLSFAEGHLIQQLLVDHIEELVQYIQECSYDAEEDDSLVTLPAPYGRKKDGTPRKSPGRKKIVKPEVTTDETKKEEV
jgi:hypothetical protein